MIYFFSITCPTCRSVILRHPLHVDFGEDLAALLNANNPNNNNNNPNNNNNNPNNNPNNNANNNPINNANNNNEDIEDIFEGETTEYVRYELPSTRQIRFLRNYRVGMLNIRLGRRVLLTADDEEPIHGCQAIIWFTG